MSPKGRTKIEKSISELKTIPDISAHTSSGKITPGSISCLHELFIKFILCFVLRALKANMEIEIKSKANECFIEIFVTCRKYSMTM